MRSPTPHRVRKSIATGAADRRRGIPQVRYHAFRLAALLAGSLIAAHALAQVPLAAPTRIESAGAGRAVARLPDGGVLVAGQFGGLLGGPMRAAVVRLSAGGQPAATFDLDIEATGNTALVLRIVVAEGTAFISGPFTRIDGQARHGLAAIDLATNQLTAFAPASPGSAPVVLDAGDGILYVAGPFGGNVIGGATRIGLAAIDVQTGLATDWNPGVALGVGTAAIAPDGLFVAGTFASIGTPSVARNRLAKLDRATGAVLPFDAGFPPGAESVRALRLVGGTLYAGGRFTSVAGQTRNSAAAFDASTGALLGFNPNVLESGQGGQFVQDIEVANDIAYLCGRFNRVGGQVRNGAAGVAATTGAVGSWDANLIGGFQCADLLLDGDGIIVTGSFREAGGRPRLGLARLDRVTAIADDTLPQLLERADFPLVAVSPDGRRVVSDANRGLVAAEGQPRANLARYRADGSLAGVIDGISGSVSALATDGTTVFVGGTSLSRNGQPPFAPLLAFDLETGEPRPAPLIESAQSGVTARVSALSVNGGDLVIGGVFNRVQGAPASAIAAVALADLALRAAPTLQGAGAAPPQVTVLASGGGRVVLLGAFSSVAGAPRLNIAALDATSYALLDFNSRVAAGQVLAVLAASDRIFLGGNFASAYDAATGTFVARNGLAALDASNAHLLPWNPNLRVAGSPDCSAVGCIVNALALHGDSLLAGGGFDTVGGQPRRSLAAIDVHSGAPLSFDAALNPGAFVSSLGIAAGTLTVGGSFIRVQGARRNAIAAFALDVLQGPDALFANGFESP